LSSSSDGAVLDWCQIMLPKQVNRYGDDRSIIWELGFLFTLENQQRGSLYGKIHCAAGVFDSRWGIRSNRCDLHIPLALWHSLDHVCAEHIARSLVDCWDAEEAMIVDRRWFSAGDEEIFLGNSLYFPVGHEVIEHIRPLRGTIASWSESDRWIYVGIMDPIQDMVSIEYQRRVLLLADAIEEVCPVTVTAIPLRRAE